MFAHTGNSVNNKAFHSRQAKAFLRSGHGFGPQSSDTVVVWGGASLASWDTHVSTWVNPEPVLAPKAKMNTAAMAMLVL